MTKATLKLLTSDYWTFETTLGISSPSAVVSLKQFLKIPKEYKGLSVIRMSLINLIRIMKAVKIFKLF